MSTPCVDHTEPLWISEMLVDRTQAAALCHPCPIKAECLAGALERREGFGVWGGVDLSPATNGRGARGKRDRHVPPPKVCQECGSEFTKPKNTSRKDWERARYCNRLCANRANLKRRVS
jgi:WhiB family redox-sensing transcriptional regulator